MQRNRILRLTQGQEDSGLLSFDKAETVRSCRCAAFDAGNVAHAEAEASNKQALRRLDWCWETSWQVRAQVEHSHDPSMPRRMLRTLSKNKEQKCIVNYPRTERPPAHTLVLPEWWQRVAKVAWGRFLSGCKPACPAPGSPGDFYHHQPVIKMRKNTQMTKCCWQ